MLQKCLRAMNTATVRYQNYRAASKAVKLEPNDFRCINPNKDFVELS